MRPPNYSQNHTVGLWDMQFYETVRVNVSMQEMGLEPRMKLDLKHTQE